MTNFNATYLTQFKNLDFKVTITSKTTTPVGASQVRLSPERYHGIDEKVKKDNNADDDGDDYDEHDTTTSVVWFLGRTVTRLGSW